MGTNSSVSSTEQTFFVSPCFVWHVSHQQVFLHRPWPPPDRHISLWCICSKNVWGRPGAEDVEFQGALSLGFSRPGGGGGGPSVVPPGFFGVFGWGGRVWICWAWLVSLGSLGSNCSQFGLLNSESRARCSGTSGSGQGFRQTLVWMGPGGRAPVSDVPEEREER